MRQAARFFPIAPMLVLFAFFLANPAAHGRGVPDSFADLAERISPSVVNITTQTDVAGSAEQPIVPEGSPLEDFFNDFLDRQDRGPAPRRGSALGSGFVISADGLIVTNNHVIEKADEITIEFFDGSELEAELIGTDPKTDIALLKVTRDEPFEFVPFGDSDIARVGDWVMAIGNPLGQGFSVSIGIISARNRSLRTSYDDFIQTDAAINRGNSGGPLFNMDGEVIGVNPAILSPTGGSIGIGFAMSSTVVTGVVEQLREYGETRRGLLGVKIQDVEPDVAEALGLEEAAGALVQAVPDGPAKDGGIKTGDVILSFDGQAIEDTRGLVRIVGGTDVGKVVDVVVYRDGQEVTLKVVIGRLEETAASAAAATPDLAPDMPAELEMIGMTLSVMTEDLRNEFEIEPDVAGVIIAKIAEDSDAYGKGLRAGDVITEVAQKQVATPTDVLEKLEGATKAGRKSILLLVLTGRDRQPRFVAVNPAEAE